MRILPLSDLHLEQWGGMSPAIDLSISKPDVVILAGDIHTGARAVEWAVNTFAGIPVLYAHGNHEGYGHNLDRVQIGIEEACEGTNVTFLNRNSVIIDGVRFIGATLWTDFLLYGEDHRRIAMYDAQQGMNDYHRIRLANKSYRKLLPSDTAMWHEQDAAYITQTLFDDFVGKNVVITHHLPTYLSVPERYTGLNLNPAYASNRDAIVVLADMWIHGHTHDSYDYKLGKCRVICNPCGYRTQGNKPENAYYNPNLIVTI